MSNLTLISLGEHSVKKSSPIQHFDQVDKPAIQASFLNDRQHRAKLHIPFLGARGPKTLCVIGQNPSAANEVYADKTIRYLEELVYRKMPQYKSILMLNLYSRVDTTKSSEGDNLNAECSRLFDLAINENEDFLVLFGQLSNQGAYRFQDRARAVAGALAGKNVFKIDLSTPYAPHPGNPKIIYRNFEVGFAPYDFSDLQGII